MENNKKNQFIKIIIIFVVILELLLIATCLLFNIFYLYYELFHIIYQSIIFIEIIPVFIIIFYYLLKLFRYLSNKSFMNTKFIIQIISLIILISFLIFEKYYSYHSELVGVLNVYKKMSPVLFSGFIIAFLYLLTLNLPSLKQIKFFDIYLVLILLLIILAPYTTDNIFLAEIKSKSNSNTGGLIYFPIYPALIIGMVFVVFLSYLLILILSVFFILIIVNFIKTIIKKDDKINIKENILNLISTLIVTGFYFSMIPMWAKFLID